MAPKYRLVIFDFDGTLADTYAWFLNVFDQVADRFGFRRLDRAATETLRAMDARQIMRHHQVPAWKVPFIARHARTLMGQNLGELSLFPGIDAALRTLDEAGAIMALVTSNARDNVTAVLGPENVARLRYLECGVSLFGKASKLQRLIRRAGVAPAEALFIGDEIRDAAAARKAGIAFGAVGWGYNRPDALVAQGPQEIFAQVADLVPALRRP